MANHEIDVWRVQAGAIGTLLVLLAACSTSTPAPTPPTGAATSPTAARTTVPTPTSKTAFPTPTTVRGAAGDPDVGTLASRRAPGGLADLRLPDSFAAVEAVYKRLPIRLAGKSYASEVGGSGTAAFYGKESDFGRPISLLARDGGSLIHYVRDPKTVGDLGAKAGGWTAGQWVANVVASRDVRGLDLGSDFDTAVNVTGSGRSNGLAWATFTIQRFAVRVQPAMVATVHGVLWGREEDQWLFLALADTDVDAEAALAGFVAAVKGEAPQVSPPGNENGTWDPREYLEPPPDYVAVPPANAPFGLHGLKMPATAAQFSALLSHMPPDLKGGQHQRGIEQQGPQMYSVIYASPTARSAYARVVATNIGSRIDLANSPRKG